jgi:endo-1,4-beta-mannosidase
VNTFLLGINYWPRRSAMYMWDRFDLGEIREDMARIRSLGLHVVRFFIMWEAFEPQRGRVDSEQLRRFEALMDAVAAADLRAMPTFFTGHMSGINYLPSWALDHGRPHGRFRTFTEGLHEAPWGCGDFYGGELFDAALVHVKAIGERCRDHPAMYMFDLGNEFSNVRFAASPQESAQWSRALTEELELASGFPSTAGNHSEDLTQDRGIRPSSFCAPFPCAVMHGYTVYLLDEFARSRTDPETIPFLCQAMQSMAGKPVLFNEFGNPTCPAGIDPSNAPYQCLTEEEMASYCYAVLDRLQRRGAVGAFWWDWADYAKELENTPPFDQNKHELTFGVVRNDGSYKPVALTLQRFAGESRRTVPPPPPIVREAQWYASMDKAYRKARYEEYLQMYAAANV